MDTNKSKPPINARLITVRIEGAIQGSGVIIKRTGDIYTVLTAYHVMSGNRIGEEVVAKTHDGRDHILEINNLQRIANTDLALTKFKANSTYSLANIGTVKDITIGQKIYIAGFPIIGKGELKVSPGELRANAPTSLDNGYELIYSSSTSPGMSGGAILLEDGQLIGIHGRGESDDLLTRVENVIAKTGFNQGMPIDFYLSYSQGEEYKSSISNNNDSYLAQAELIVSTTISGSEKTVLRLLQKAEEMGNNSPRIRFIKSLAYNNLKEHDKALSELNVLTSLYPNSFQYHLNTGYTLSMLGRQKESLAATERALEVARNEWDQTKDPEIGIKLIAGSINHAINLHIAGERLREASELARVAQFIQSLESEYLNDKYMPIVHARFGMYFFAENDLKTAKKAFEASLSIKDNALAHSELAQLHRAEEKYDLSAKHYRLAIQMDPYVKHFYHQYAQTLLMQKKPSEALIQLDKSLALDSEYLNSINLKARILRQSGRISESMEMISKSLEINPVQHFVLHERALIYQAKSQYHLALTDYKEAIRLNPDNYVYYANQFSTLMKLGMYPEGLESIDTAIRLGPNDPMNYTKRAVAKAFMKSNLESICLDVKKAYSLGDRKAAALMQTCIRNGQG